MKTYIIEYEIDGRLLETRIEAFDHVLAMSEFNLNNPGASIRVCYLKEELK